MRRRSKKRKKKNEKKKKEKKKEDRSHESTLLHLPWMSHYKIYERCNSCKDDSTKLINHWILHILYVHVSMYNLWSYKFVGIFDDKMGIYFVGPTQVSEYL